MSVFEKVFNVKQMAQTCNYLREHGLLDYAELEEKAAAATEQFHALFAQIKAAETPRKAKWVPLYPA